MSPVEIHVAVDDLGVSTLTVGTGSRHNALGPDTWAQIADWASSLEDTPNAPAAVITGSGGAFSSGADLRRWQDARGTEIAETFDAMEQAFRAIERAPMPTIACVDGAAMGAGCQLALACDLRLASNRARFGMPILRLGIVPNEAFSRRLVRAAGLSVATGMLLLGRTYDAGEALANGLVHDVVDAAAMAAAARSVCEQLAGLPGGAVRGALEQLRPRTSETALAPRVLENDFRRRISELLARP